MRSELGLLRSAVITATEEAGRQVLAAGTHPFADWREQAITSKERYLESRADLPMLACQAVIDLGGDEPQEGSAVDVLIRAALGTGAAVRVVPAQALPEQVGAILRW